MDYDRKIGAGLRFALSRRACFQPWVRFSRGLDTIESMSEQKKRREATVGLANGKRPTSKLRDILERSWRDYQANGGIPHEKFWADLAKETKPRSRSS